MVTTLTVSLSELVIDGFDPQSLNLTLQLNQKAQKFYSPFENMNIKTQRLSSDDSLFLIFASGVQELGHGQVALDGLKTLQKLEKSSFISKFIKNQEKNSIQKMMNIGKFKVFISLQQEDESCFDDQLVSLKEAYSGIQEIFQDFWKIQAPLQTDLESLGLAVINDEQYLRETDFDHLKMLALGMNEKVKLIQLLRKQLEEKTTLSEKNLQMYESSLIQLSTQKEKFEVIIQNHSTENSLNLKSLQDNQNENLSLKEKVNSLSLELDTLKGQIIFLTSEAEKNQVKASANDQLSLLVDSLQNQISDLQISRSELRSQLENSLKSNSELSDSFFSENQNLQDQLDKRFIEIESLSQKLSNQTDTIDNQNSEILSLNLQIENYHKRLLAYSDLEETLEGLRESHSKLLSNFSSLQNSFKDSLSNFSELRQSLSEEKEKIWTCSREIQDQNMSLQSSNLKFSSDQNLLKIEKLSLESDLNSTQQMVILTHDAESLSKELQLVSTAAEKMASAAIKEMETMADYLLVQSEKILNNSRAINRLAQSSVDKENEIQVLRDMVSDLQRRRAVYFPAKDDVIDSAIADFVNTRGTEVPFTREDHGIYVFGSKRVFVKLENGKIVRI
jgi:hypothetical protein